MSGICYIIGAGEMAEQLITIRREDLLIAADGGFKTCLERGLKPDIVVGDFDSLGYVPECENLIKHPAEKNATDIELAVEEGSLRGYYNFVIYGALGGRLGHTLGNLQLIAGMSRKGQCAILVGKESVAQCITNGTIRFTGDRQGYLSVFSMNGDAEGVSLTNVKYELSDAKMPASGTLGVSNEFTNQPAKVAVRKGTLLAIWKNNEFDACSHLAANK